MWPPDQAARVVRERDRHRLRTMGLALGLSACLAASALSVVWLKVQQVRLSYRLDVLRSAKGELDDLNRQLRVELASLRSLARIEDRAKSELGMILPAPGQIRLAREFVAGGEGAASLRTAWEIRAPDGRQLR
jgi:cell division protein FtsL